MKQATALIFCAIMLIALCVGIVMAGEIKSTGLKGTWNVGTTWNTGVVPTSSDNVTIADGDTVILNGARVTCTCNNLTIGEGTSGRLRFITTDTVNLVVYGNIVVSANATFIVNTNTISGSTGVAHTLDLKGNLTNSGTLDFRSGTAGTTLSVCNLTLSGTTNSILNVPYVSSTNGEFNSIAINKTSGAKVILASDIITAGGSTTGPSVCNVVINFTSGIVETGNFKFAYQGATAAQVIGYSATSYVNGNFARGMSNSAGASKDFPVGDANNYRPLYVRSTTSGGGTGHLVIVKCVSGNANTGSSSLNGGIDKVSTVRYYQITYSNAISGLPSMSFDLMKPTYGTDDGVTAGNTDLRVAYSADNRATWNGLGQTTTPHTTSASAQIYPDSLATGNVITLNSASSFYVALARVTGTTTNTLQTPTGVTGNNFAPSIYALNQNYPNPFNPSTNFTYQLGKSGFVSVKVYDVLGREVATLVNEVQQSGIHPATWNAAGFGSGIYFCKMQSGSFSDVKKLILMK